MDASVTAHREGAQQTIRKLGRQIHADLSTDRKRQAEEAGSTIDSLLVLDPPLLREAWVQM